MHISWIASMFINVESTTTEHPPRPMDRRDADLTETPVFSSTLSSVWDAETREKAF